MNVVNQILEKTSKEAEKYKPTTVKKHLELEYDLGSLMAFDNNELDDKLLNGNRDDYLLDLTRDNTQLLLNHIWELPTERVEEAVVVKLPGRITLLPRMKPVPKPRPLTKWQQFAKEKGIQKTKKNKLSWDDQLKKWVPLFGFKRTQAEKDKSWVLEVPGNANPMEDQFAKKAAMKGEKVAKNELQRLRNIAKARNVKVPRVGLLNTNVSTAKELQAAVTVAKASTASLGKFQEKLSHEKEARGIQAITPSSNRKRKLAPVPAQQEKSENLAIVDSLLNKRPRLNVESAISKKISVSDNNQSFPEPQRSRNTSSKKKSKGSSSAKKPKGGKGARKGKSGGRKRR